MQNWFEPPMCIVDCLYNTDALIIQKSRGYKLPRNKKNKPRRCETMRGILF